MDGRMTKGGREGTLNRLLKHRFEAPQEALRKEEHAFALEVYCDVLSGKDRKLLDSLPDGWVPGIAHVQVVLGGTYAHIPLGEEKRAPMRMRSGWIKSYDASHKLTIRYREIMDREATLKEQRERVKVQARALMWSLNTWKQLEEAWPEVVPFFPDAAPVKAGLPALNIAELNKALGLPVEGEKA